MVENTTNQSCVLLVEGPTEIMTSLGVVSIIHIPAVEIRLRSRRERTRLVLRSAGRPLSKQVIPIATRRK
jgi:hypothetical protein